MTTQTEASEQGPNDRRADRPPEKGPKPELIVTYNGVDPDFDYDGKLQMPVLLEKSMDAFNITENRHTMALWTSDGRELPNEGTLRDAGVKRHDVLVLRPSAVRGGSC